MMSEMSLAMRESYLVVLQRVGLRGPDLQGDASATPRKKTKVEVDTRVTPAACEMDAAIVSLIFLD